MGSRRTAASGRPVTERTKPAEPAELTATLRDTPVDGDWLRELLAEREHERAGASDP